MSAVALFLCYWVTFHWLSDLTWHWHKRHRGRYGTILLTNSSSFWQNLSYGCFSLFYMYMFSLLSFVWNKRLCVMTSCEYQRIPTLLKFGSLVLRFTKIVKNVVLAYSGIINLSHLNLNPMWQGVRFIRLVPRRKWKFLIVNDTKSTKNYVKLYFILEKYETHETS